MLKQIKEEAALRRDTVRYLQRYPYAVSGAKEKCWLQIQYLLDRLEIVDAKGDLHQAIIDLTNHLRKELKE